MDIRVILRLIAAILAGIIVSFCVIVLFEGINAKFYPSEHINPTIEQMAEQLRSLPMQAFLIVLFGYIISSFFGGYTAARIAPNTRKEIAAFTVGFFLLLSGIVNFFSIPHPTWLTISSCVSFILFSYLGGKLATRKSK
jgi:type IV secretory pathway TrbL component